MRSFRQTLPGHAGENRLRPDLQEQLAALLGERLHAVGEVDRLARMIAPVARLGRRREPATAQVGDERNSWRGVFHGGRHLRESLQHRLEEVRMERMRDSQGHGGDTLLLQRRANRLDRGRLARDHGVGGPVERGESDAIGERLDRRAGAGGVGEHRGHRAARRQRFHQAAALGNQPQAVFQREHARDARRDVLADLWPRTAAGTTPQTCHSSAMRVLHGEERRLRVLGAVEQRRSPANSTSRERPRRRYAASSASQRPIDFAEDAAASRRAPAHPGVLGPLAGEEEHHLGAAPGTAPSRRAGGAPAAPRARGSAARASSGVRATTAARSSKCARPALAVRRRRQRGAVLRAPLRTGARAPRGPAGVRADSGKQRAERSTPSPAPPARAGASSRSDVRVGAAEAERADACQSPPPRRAATASGSVATCTGSVSQGMCGFGVAEVEVPAGCCSCCSASTTLMTPAMPAADLEVADVRLHRADQERPLAGAACAEHGGEAPGPRSDRRGGAGAVRFDVVDLARAARRRRRAPSRMTASCAGPFGHGEAAAAAVLVDRRCRGSPRGCGRRRAARRAAA